MKRMSIGVTALVLLVPAAARGAQIKMPTGNGGIQYRPYVITVSADGAVYFGGSTGRRFADRRRSLRDLGRLHWTYYGATDARATGVLWGLYGPGSFASDTKFENGGVVSLHAYRPLQGVFTRLRYSSRAKFRTSDGRIVRYTYQGTANANSSGGVWYW